MLNASRAEYTLCIMPVGMNILFYKAYGAGYTVRIMPVGLSIHVCSDCGAEYTVCIMPVGLSIHVSIMPVSLSIQFAQCLWGWVYCLHDACGAEGVSCCMMPLGLSKLSVHCLSG